MTTATEVAAQPASWTTRSRLLSGLLVVQIIVGFEFFWSVLTKLVRGGFASGLGADLQDRVKAAPSWYASFANNVIVPHATLFAYLIIASELFVGVAMIAAAVIWLMRWDTMARPGRIALVVFIGLAAAAALFLNLNFHIANGATNPWQIGESAFDEAVDINMILALIDATILAVMVAVFISLRPRGR